MSSLLKKRTKEKSTTPLNTKELRPYAMNRNSESSKKAFDKLGCDPTSIKLMQLLGVDERTLTSAFREEMKTHAGPRFPAARTFSTNFPEDLIDLGSYVSSDQPATMEQDSPPPIQASPSVDSGDASLTDLSSETETDRETLKPPPSISTDDSSDSEHAPSQADPEERPYETLIQRVRHSTNISAYFALSFESGPRSLVSASSPRSSSSRSHSLYLSPNNLVNSPPLSRKISPRKGSLSKVRKGSILQRKKHSESTHSDPTSSGESQGASPNPTPTASSTTTPEESPESSPRLPNPPSSDHISPQHSPPLSPNSRIAQTTSSSSSESPSRSPSPSPSPSPIASPSPSPSPSPSASPSPSTLSPSFSTASAICFSFLILSLLLFFLSARTLR
eukprot:TRINITY_DN509_c0_g7_i1.p1 TRINITY_DN509_c0_g7~~TRINITY_DN509_c0_g7_i1.p1  ORF type:complete len:391 (-),score=86.88 TRINITY_DN509_c0_g7_i1:4-1176(-)